MQFLNTEVQNRSVNLRCFHHVRGLEVGEVEEIISRVP